MVLLLRILAVLGGLGAAVHRLATQGNRIETKLELIVATIDELVTKVEGLKTDVARVIGALAGERISPETQAKVDALAASLDEVNATMDQAVPERTGEPTTPGEEPSEPTDG